MNGGAGILAAITDAREEIARKQAKGRRALEVIAGKFHLDTSSPIQRAALHFVEIWQSKKINETNELAEFLE
ncbi:MAG: hypothetical protein DMG79_06040, partial [Acidobacteria bacterium]